ncbi:MAG: hypothetical protein ACRC6J_03375, partial [Cetobacterium sp.]
MNAFKLLVVFTFIYTSLLSSDVYIPKNRAEKEYLEKIKSKTLVVGKKINYFADYEVENDSLNKIIDEMLTQYLGLSIIEEKGSWDKIYNGFKRKEIDILNFLNYSEERSEYALFSNEITTENLMVISKDKKINKIEDLEDMDFYVTKDSIHEFFLNRIIKRNSLNTKIISLGDVDLKRKYPYAISDIDILGEKNKLNLGKIPGSSIGLQKEYYELL